MNREQFLNRLEILLQDISEEERVEALAFYRSYFEDAGENKEEDIIRELESPEKVAQSIKADLAGTAEDSGQSAPNQGSRHRMHIPTLITSRNTLTMSIRLSRICRVLRRKRRIQLQLYLVLLLQF